MHDSAGHMHDSVGHMHSAPHIQTRIGELTTTFLSLSHPLLSHLSISFSLEVSAESALHALLLQKVDEPVRSLERARVM